MESNENFEYYTGYDNQDEYYAENEYYDEYNYQNQAQYDAQYPGTKQRARFDNLSLQNMILIYFSSYICFITLTILSN